MYKRLRDFIIRYCWRITIYAPKPFPTSQLLYRTAIQAVTSLHPLKPDRMQWMQTFVVSMMSDVMVLLILMGLQNSFQTQCTVRLAYDRISRITNHEWNDDVVYFRIRRIIKINHHFDRSVRLISNEIVNKWDVYLTQLSSLIKRLFNETSEILQINDHSVCDASTQLGGWIGALDRGIKYLRDCNT